MRRGWRQTLACVIESTCYRLNETDYSVCGQLDIHTLASRYFLKRCREVSAGLFAEPLPNIRYIDLDGEPQLDACEPDCNEQNEPETHFFLI